MTVWWWLQRSGSLKRCCLRLYRPGFPFELSRDITEISPLWELLPFNLSWSPIGSRQSNDWPIVAKHANMMSSRQYKCDARDNYIRIFYFTLNSWWLQYVRSARDQSNRWIITVVLNRRLAVPPNPTVASFPDFLPRGLFPPPFQYRGIRILWPRGGRRGHVHLGLGEGGFGGIGARAVKQLRAFRPPGGAHEGSV